MSGIAERLLVFAGGIVAFPVLFITIVLAGFSFLGWVASLFLFPIWAIEGHGWLVFFFLLGWTGAIWFVGDLLAGRISIRRGYVGYISLQSLLAGFAAYSASLIYQRFGWVS